MSETLAIECYSSSPKFYKKREGLPMCKDCDEMDDHNYKEPCFDCPYYDFCGGGFEMGIDFVLDQLIADGVIIGYDRKAGRVDVDYWGIFIEDGLNLKRVRADELVKARERNGR